MRLSKILGFFRRNIFWFGAYGRLLKEYEGLQDECIAEIKQTAGLVMENRIINNENKYQKDEIDCLKIRINILEESNRKLINATLIFESQLLEKDTEIKRLDSLLNPQRESPKPRCKK